MHFEGAQKNICWSNQSSFIKQLPRGGRRAPAACVKLAVHLLVRSVIEVKLYLPRRKSKHRGNNGERGSISLYKGWNQGVKPQVGVRCFAS
jgi:hypothetical protein